MGRGPRLSRQLELTELEFNFPQIRTRSYLLQDREDLIWIGLTETRLEVCLRPPQRQPIQRFFSRQVPQVKSCSEDFQKELLPKQNCATHAGREMFRAIRVWEFFAWKFV